MRLKILNEGLFDNSMNEDISKYAGSIVSSLRNIKKILNIPNVGVYYFVPTRTMRLFMLDINGKPLQIDDKLINSDENAIKRKFLDIVLCSRVARNLCIFNEFEFRINNDDSYTALTRHTMYMPNEWFEVRVS